MFINLRNKNSSFVLEFALKKCKSHEISDNYLKIRCSSLQDLGISQGPPQSPDCCRPVAAGFLTQVVPPSGLRLSQTNVEMFPLIYTIKDWTKVPFTLSPFFL